MLEIPVTVASLLPNFMTPEGTVLLWSIFVFFALLAVLWKFAFGPIMHALEEREHKIQGDIDAAANKLKEATAKLAEYQAQVNAANDKVAAMIADGKRAVEALTADEKAKAKQEIESDKERAKREIALAKDAAVAELRDKVVALTGDIAAKVIRREIKADDHRTFIAQALSEIGANKN